MCPASEIWLSCDSKLCLFLVSQQTDAFHPSKVNNWITRPASLTQFYFGFYSFFFWLMTLEWKALSGCRFLFSVKPNRRLQWWQPRKDGFDQLFGSAITESRAKPWWLHLKGSFYPFGISASLFRNVNGAKTLRVKHCNNFRSFALDTVVVLATNPQYLLGMTVQSGSTAIVRSLGQIVIQ